MCKNSEVAEAWKNGKSAQNSRGNFRSNGYRLFSYDMCIGLTLRNGRKIALNQWGEYRTTNSTARHAREAAYVADEVVAPLQNDFHTGIQTCWDGSPRRIKIWHFPPNTLAEADLH